MGRDWPHNTTRWGKVLAFGLVVLLQVFIVTLEWDFSFPQTGILSYNFSMMVWKVTWSYSLDFDNFKTMWSRILLYRQFLECVLHGAFHCLSTTWTEGQDGLLYLLLGLSVCLSNTRCNILFIKTEHQLISSHIWHLCSGDVSKSLDCQYLDNCDNQPEQEVGFCFNSALSEWLLGKKSPISLCEIMPADTQGSPDPDPALA